MSNKETSINEALNPNASFASEHEDKSFTQEQIEQYSLNTDDSEEKLILGKFKSQEDLQKAYKELENKFHGNKDDKGRDEGQEKGKGITDETKSKEEEGESSDEVDSKDSDDSDDSPKAKVDSAFKTLRDTGELTDDVKKAFEEVGISEDLIQHFKDLSDFKTATEMQEIVSEVGSQEDYDSLISWAGENLTDDEINTFDNIIDEGTVEDIKLAIDNLKSKYTGNLTPVTPKSDNLVKADIVANTSGFYESQAEMMLDMNDPRYKTDEKFRQSVMKKLSKSNL